MAVCSSVSLCSLCTISTRMSLLVDTTPFRSGDQGAGELDMASGGGASASLSCPTARARSAAQRGLEAGGFHAESHVAGSLYDTAGGSRVQ